MCRDFDDMAYMFLIVINSKKFWRYRYNCVWDYHISLESLNPNTLNTRLNKSSLRETLHYYYLFEQLYYLLAISALSITITYTLLLSIARTSKQEYYSYITNYLVALDWLFPYLKWSKLYLLTYLLTFLLFKVGIFGYRNTGYSKMFIKWYYDRKTKK